MKRNLVAFTCDLCGNTERLTSPADTELPEHWIDIMRISEQKHLCDTCCEEIDATLHPKQTPRKPLVMSGIKVTVPTGDLEGIGPDAD